MDQPSPIKTTPSAAVNFDTAIPAFKNLVARLIRESWETEEARTHFQLLADGMEKMLPKLSEIGDSAAYEVSQSSENFIPWFITFDWMHNAKSFLLLWRDILFQEQRAWLKVSSGEVSIEQFSALRHATKQSITDAFSTLFIDLESASSHPLNNTKQLERWGLQDMPWSIYKEQLKQFPEQAESLIRQFEMLSNSSGVFVLVASQFKEIYDFWLNQISTLRNSLQVIINHLEKEELNADWLNEELEKADDLWEKPDNSEVFHADLDDYVSRLPERERIYADADGGLLLYKELNLRSEVRAWLESELLSEIYELFMIRDGITNKMHLNMVSIKNLLLLDEEGQLLSDKEPIVKVLTNFLKSLSRSEERTIQLKEVSEQKIKKDFTLSNIYKDDFLARPLQYTISQYRDSARWMEIRSWFRKQGARVNQLQRNVLAEEALSISERIVRVVNSRRPDPENSHYTNMFLTKGWIGDSFVVGRESEMARVASMIENWKLGFRGAVMVTGKRFSGKTLFGELIDHRFFNNRAIKLMPHTRCVLPGKKKRHLDVACDLDAALKFVARFSKEEKAMIWIDNLEYWRSDKNSLAENVSNLLSYIDNYSDRLFFVVGMSNWLKTKLSTAFEIDKVFQSEINLGYMSSANVRNAILVRHSATHTVLYNEENEEITGSQLTRIINRINQISEGNIGEALQRWAYTVEKIDEERIRLPKTSYHALPPFLSTDAALLLQSVMMEKTSSEKQLRKLFGPAYTKTYGVTLKRMLNLGLLEKTQGREIIVNRYLSNEIGKLLSNKIDFQYSHQTNTKKQVRI